MRPSRQPRIIWDEATRPRILARDGYQCVRCGLAVTKSTANIDHVIPLACGGTNEDSNLRTLCRRCHVLRIDRRHRGMISKALKDGIIEPAYRHLMWSTIPDKE